MICPNCGNQMNENEKFCTICGSEILQTDQNINKDNNNITHNNNDGNIYFMTLPIWKYIILNIITFGIYNIVWFYKYWKAVKDATQKRLSPFWRGFFGGLTCLSLFPTINENTQNILAQRPITNANQYSDKSEFLFNAQAFAWTFFLTSIAPNLLSRLSKVAVEYANTFSVLTYILSLVNMIIIIIIQIKINNLNKAYNLPAENNAWTLKNTLWTVGWILLLFVLIILLVLALAIAKAN